MNTTYPATLQPPAGMVALSPESAAPTTLDRIAGGTHGYLSTGVLTGGGRGIEGDALVPIVPGRVTLDVGGGTGRTPLAISTAGGARVVAADTAAYHIALHAKVTDQVDIGVSFSQDSVTMPKRK